MRIRLLGLKGCLLMNKINKERLRSGILAVILMLLLLLTGTYAWTQFNNIGFSTVDVGTNFGGRIHDNLQWNSEEAIGIHEKTMFAENFGSNRLFVRARLQEFMTTGEQEPLIMGTSINHPNGFGNYAQALANLEETPNPNEFEWPAGVYRPWPAYVAVDRSPHIRMMNSPAALIAATGLQWTLGHGDGDLYFMPTFNQTQIAAAEIDQNLDSFWNFINDNNAEQVFRMIDASGDAIDAVAGGFNIANIDGAGELRESGMQTTVARADGEISDGSRDFWAGGVESEPVHPIWVNEETGVLEPHPDYDEALVNVSRPTLSPTTLGNITDGVMTFQQWREAGEPVNEEQNFWVMDPETGWFYFSRPLQPGEATPSLISEIYLNDLNDEGIEYAVQVDAQFATHSQIHSMFDGQTVPEEVMLLWDVVGISNLWVRSIQGSHISTTTPHDVAPYMIEWLEVGDIYYLMIPNSADINNLSVHFESDLPVFVDGEEIVSGRGTNVFADRIGEIVTLTSGGRQHQVVAMQSSEIPTMFIQTDSGSLDFVHENRNNREPAQILLIEEDGRTVNFNGRADRFNGRGNSTWNRPKRPYNIRLAGGGTNGPAELLGMGTHRHWALLANDFDNSHIRNLISHELANEVGMEFAMQVRPVDVFINNQYHGLYLLSERIRIDTVAPITDLEAATEAVNPGVDLSSLPRRGNMQPVPGTFRYFDIPNNPADITGGYLLEWQFSSRYNAVNADPSSFVTNRSQAIMLGAPEFASRAQIEYISNFVQEMEDAVYSSTGYNALGRHFREYIDVESFAKMYVLLEFLRDQDGWVTSFYVYKESDLVGDGLLRAAPPWDFDLTFGNTTGNDGINLPNPAAFFINTRLIGGGAQINGPSMITALWSHQEFRDEAMRIWNEEFAPVVGTLTADNVAESSRLRSIREDQANIQRSTDMEWIRWNRTRSHGQYVDALFNFAQSRINFLNAQWGN